MAQSWSFDSGPLCWLHVFFISWGYDRFSSGFNFPISPLPSIPCKKQIKASLLCIFSKESISHSNQIWTTTKKKTYWVTLMGRSLWLGWVGRERNKDIWKWRLSPLGLDRQQSTLNHLIAREFPPYYHLALLGRRHVTCSLCLLEGWIKLFQLDKHLWNVCLKVAPMLVARDITLKHFQLKRVVNNEL